MAVLDTPVWCIHVVHVTAFGITRDVDISFVKWEEGSGDPEELDKPSSCFHSYHQGVHCRVSSCSCC